MHIKQKQTDLPVLLSPKRPVLNTHSTLQGGTITPTVFFSFALLWLVSIGVAQAQNDAVAESILAILWKWMPVILSAFFFNIMISFLAMLLGTVSGAILGLMQISLLPPIRFSSWILTQFFRNAPWLVLLFFVATQLPYEFDVFGYTVPFPDWVKAVIGLALPVMANVSEIVRGAVRSLPTGQWEAAESLAYSRSQQLWLIILPQCYKRMLPPWMNLYAILTMATVLVSLVGVEEVLSLARQAIIAEGNDLLLAPMYGLVLLLFFFYCYPITLYTQRLERRFAVKF